jgi:hypothetical protein
MAGREPLNATLKRSMEAKPGAFGMFEVDSRWTS